METFEFLGFGLYAWITIITVLGMFTVLLFTKLRSDLVFLSAIGILYVTGVLDAKEAFSGFSSTSVIVIGVLFVVVAGLTHTGVLQWIVKNLLGEPNSYSKAVMRLMLPVAGLSSFLSNTTVVALFVGTFITEFISNTAAGAMFFPIMYDAAETLGYEPYTFLIALMISVSSSFATPIGSPTHMLVYAPGGYRFSDFMCIGLLMNLIILAANIFIVNIVYPLTPLQ